MRVMLRKHKLEYPGDFTIVEAQFPNMKALLADKKVDLIVGVKPFTMDPACRRSRKTCSRSARRSA